MKGEKTGAKNGFLYPLYNLYYLCTFAVFLLFLLFFFWFFPLPLPHVRLLRLRFLLLLLHHHHHHHHHHHLPRCSRASGHAGEQGSALQVVWEFKTNNKKKEE